MRILHVISGIDPSNGGPAAALVGLTTAQVQVGLDVTVVATHSAGCDLTPADRLRENGVAVRLVGPCGGMFYTHPQLGPTLDELVARADFVHIHALWESIHHHACRTAQRHGVPYVLRPCGMLDPWSLNQGWLKKRLYLLCRMRRNLDRAMAIHCTSPMEGEQVSRLRLNAPVLVEPNGLNLEEFAVLPPAGTFRSKYPQLGESRYVAYLGRIYAGKGLELLVPAFARAGVTGTKLVIIGPDWQGYQTRVEAMVKENGLEDRVIFTGLVRGRERVAALAEATLFCLPSHHENFGIAVVEALAAGTPVIISDHVYIHQTLSAGGVAGVVPLEVNALAAELSRWLHDEGLRSAAAARARPFVAERYDWRMIARRWVEHYARFASVPRPVGTGVA